MVVVVSIVHELEQVSVHFPPGFLFSLPPKGKAVPGENSLPRPAGSLFSGSTNGDCIALISVVGRSSRQPVGSTRRCTPLHERLRGEARPPPSCYYKMSPRPPFRVTQTVEPSTSSITSTERRHCPNGDGISSRWQNETRSPLPLLRAFQPAHTHGSFQPDRLGGSQGLD